MPVVNDQGHRALDAGQAHFLDGLDTDRLLLQVDLHFDNTGASHYVALRRDGDRWVLLDSLSGEPQYDVSPSDYLLNQGATNFTAIWPQNRLVVSLPAGALAYGTKSAHNHWTGTRKAEFSGLLAQWNQATGGAAKGSALLQRLSARCDAELAAGRGEQVDDEGLVFAFMVTPHQGMPPVRVWRAVEGNRVRNLRQAPVQDDAEAREALLKGMRTAAKLSRR